MLILGDVGLQIRLSKGTIGKAEAVNMKWNSHRWDKKFPSVGQGIPIGGTRNSHRWEFLFKLY